MKRNIFDSFSREAEVPLYARILLVVGLLTLGWLIGAQF